MIPKPLVVGRGANDRKRESERTDERRRPRKVNSLLFFFSRLSFRCPPLLLLRASALGSLRASTRKEGGSPFESGISPDRKKKLTFFPLLFSFCTSTSFPLFLSLFLFLSLSLSLSLSFSFSLSCSFSSPKQNVSRASAVYSDAGDIPDRSGRSSFETSPGGSQHGAPNAFGGGGGGGYFQNHNPNLGRPSLARSSTSGPSAARAPVMSGQWTTRAKSLKKGNVRASSAFSAKGHGSSAAGGGGGDEDGKGGAGVIPGESGKTFLPFLLLFRKPARCLSSRSSRSSRSPLLLLALTPPGSPLTSLSKRNDDRHLGLVPRRRRAPPEVDHPAQRDALSGLVPGHAAGLAVDRVLHAVRHRVLRGAGAR